MECKNFGEKEVLIDTNEITEMVMILEEIETNHLVVRITIVHLMVHGRVTMKGK